MSRSFSLQSAAIVILRAMDKAVSITMGFLAAIASAAAAATLPSSAWDIGPTIRGKNYSQGMPRHPASTKTGWSFDFPFSDARAGHVHYVTFDPGSLAGKSRIVVRYRVDAARDVRFVPQESPAQPATVSLVFQRAGDDWRARGRFEFYRWYSPPSTVRPIRPGEYEINVSLRDPGWISVLGRPPATNPEAFADALANANRVGLVFGSAGARGHGVYATGPARFTLVNFDIF